MKSAKEKPDLLVFEREYLEKGVALIAGVDEVGRGPLAGPVMVCAYIPDFSVIIDGVNDSKQLTDKKRRALYPKLIESAVAYKTFSVSPEKIDEINILEATKFAMKEAILSLFPVPQTVFIDAVKLDIPYPMRAIIHGDALSYSIAAASIVAKVERDTLMEKYAELYPEYGFEGHKGYGSAKHIAAIKEYGPCPIHRRSFLKNILGDK